MSTRIHVSRVTIALREDRHATEAYRVHQHIASLFEGRRAATSGAADARRPYLYRIASRRPGGLSVLVHSAAKPTTPEELPIHPTGAVLGVETKAVEFDLKPGQLLDFQVRLNATTSRDGQRMDVWDAAGRDGQDWSWNDAYRNYLRRRLAGAAEVLVARVTERIWIEARVRNGGSGARFIAVEMEGTLRVEDPAALETLLLAGVGRSKGFGCGLLCLSRPGTMLPRSPVATAHAAD